MGQYSDELRNLDSLFQQAPEPDQPVPDGTYQAAILATHIIRSKNNPNLLFLKLECGIESGDQDGQTVEILQALNPEDTKRLTFLKRFLRRLGYDEATLSGLDDWLPRLIGRMYEIQIKTNGQYQNIYINRRLDVSRLPTQSTSSSEELPDDLPF